MQIIHGKKYFEAPPIHKISDIVERGLELYSERNAVVYRSFGQGDPIYVSYKQLYEDTKSVRESLIRAGLVGERVSVVGSNSYPWMLTYLAMCDDVGVICPLDSLLTGFEMMQLIQRSNSAAVFLDTKRIVELTPFVKECPEVKYWVGMEIHEEHDAEIVSNFKSEVAKQGAHFITMEEWIGLGAEVVRVEGYTELEQINENELAVLLFTSGTTANSKAVMLSNGNITADIRALLETVKFVDPLKSLSILPIHHTFENTCGFLTVLTLGGQIHLIDGLRHIGKNLKEYGVHMVIAVPKIFETLHRRVVQNIKRAGQWKKFSFGRKLSRFLMFFGIDKRRQIFKDILQELGGEFYIAICGAAAIDKNILDFFYDIGVEILQGFGLTETSPVVTGCNTQYNVRGSCGQPLSGVTLAIDTDIPGEPGEILIKGDMVTLGYYQNEEANKEAFREDGWFNTGDIGFIESKKDVLYLTGRTKSMIVLPSGKKVFPEELESLLNENDYIKDSLVYGHNEDDGEIVLSAKVVLDEEKLKEDNVSEESAQKLLATYIARINKLLPAFKGIRSYMYSFQDMIKTTTLKVKRNVEIDRLKDIFARTKLSWRDSIGLNIDNLEKTTDSDEKTVLEEKKKTSQ